MYTYTSQNMRLVVELHTKPLTVTGTHRSTRAINCMNWDPLLINDLSVAISLGACDCSWHDGSEQPRFRRGTLASFAGRPVPPPSHTHLGMFCLLLARSWRTASSRGRERRRNHLRRRISLEDTTSPLLPRLLELGLGGIVLGRPLGGGAVHRRHALVDLAWAGQRCLGRFSGKAPMPIRRKLCTVCFTG